MDLGFFIFLNIVMTLQNISFQTSHNTVTGWELITNYSATNVFKTMFSSGILIDFAGFGGNGATMFFLVFALLASVLGIVSKIAGGNHLRVWRNDSLAAAGSSSLVAWAVTALAFGYLFYELSYLYRNIFTHSLADVEA